MNSTLANYLQGNETADGVAREDFSPSERIAGTSGRKMPKNCQVEVKFFD